MKLFELYKPAILAPDNYRGRQLTYFKKGIKRYIAITYNISRNQLFITNASEIVTIYNQKPSINLSNIK